MPSKVTPFKIVLDGVTSATTSAQLVNQIFDQSKDYCVTFTSTGTTSGGTLKIEESDDPQFLGTWSQIGTDISASAFSGTAKQCYHIRVGAGMYARVRISADVTGGGSVRVSVCGM